MANALIQRSREFLIKHFFWLVSSLLGIVVGLAFGLVVDIAPETNAFKFHFQEGVWTKIVTGFVLAQGVNLIRELMSLADRTKSLDESQRATREAIERQLTQLSGNVDHLARAGRLDGALLRIAEGVGRIAPVHDYVHELCERIDHLGEHGALHLKHESEIFNLDLCLLQEIRARQLAVPEGRRSFCATIYVDDLGAFEDTLRDDPIYRRYVDEVSEAARSNVHVRRLFIVRSDDVLASTVVVDHFRSLKQSNVSIALVRANRKVQSRINEINSKDIILFDNLAVSEGKNFFMGNAHGSASYFFSDGHLGTGHRRDQLRKDFEMLWSLRDPRDRIPTDLRSLLD